MPRLGRPRLGSAKVGVALQNSATLGSALQPKLCIALRNILNPEPCRALQNPLSLTLRYINQYQIIHIFINIL